MSDCTQLAISLDIGPDITPRAAMTDKGYDSKANRAACRERGIVPVILYRSNAKDRPSFFPKVLYKGRARVEQAMGKLKRFKRIALRCEKTAESYAALVAFACSMILIKIAGLGTSPSLDAQPTQATPNTGILASPTIPEHSKPTQLRYIEVVRSPNDGGNAEVGPIWEQCKLGGVDVRGSRNFREHRSPSWLILWASTCIERPATVKRNGIISPCTSASSTALRSR